MGGGHDTVTYTPRFYGWGDKGQILCEERQQKWLSLLLQTGKRKQAGLSMAARRSVHLER